MRRREAEDEEEGEKMSISWALPRLSTLLESAGHPRDGVAAAGIPLPVQEAKMSEKMLLAIC